MKSRKYIVLIGALLAQLTIGALYAWSILNTAIVDHYGWNSDDVLTTYAIAQFVFAFSTILSGKIIDLKGPKWNLLIGGTLYGSGLVLSSFATSPIILYLTYGILSGTGIGFIYVTPLSTLLKWFPNRKGLITGIAVAVFGGGSILFKELMIWLLSTYPISKTFIYLGIISITIIFLSALLVTLPKNFEKKQLIKQSHDFTPKEMMKTTAFKKTWIMYLFAVLPGMLLLGAAKEIGLDNQMTIKAATNLITILAISNATSRIIVGFLADRFGTLRMIRISFFITILSLVFISFLSSILPLFYIAIIGISFAYGGFLCLFPTWTNQTFGSYRYGSNYGLIFQAYGLSALLGIFIKDISGTFHSTFIISIGISLIGVIIAFTLKNHRIHVSSLSSKKSY